MGIYNLYTVISLFEYGYAKWVKVVLIYIIKWARLRSVAALKTDNSPIYII